MPEVDEVQRWSPGAGYAHSTRRYLIGASE